MRKSILLLASVALALLLASGAALTVGSEPARAAFPGTNGKIVFAQDLTDLGLGRHSDTIKRISPNGSGLSTLLNDPYEAHDANPSFSPNGTRVAYANRKAGQPDLRMEIYKINVATRGITQITNNTQFDGNPTWSPDGTRIAFEHERVLPDGTRDVDIFVKRSDGTGKTVNKTRNPTEDDLAPAWSPDGEEIAFHTATTRDIVVLNLLTGVRRNLTDDGTAQVDQSPSWSPDGTRIVFESLTLSEEGLNQDSIITMKSSDGSDRRLLAQVHRDPTDGSGAYFAGSTYSPDGEQIAYVHTGTDYVYGDPQLWKMNASDGSDKRLVYDAYDPGPGHYPYTEEVYLTSPDWGEQRPR